jgi:hypothetical protein
VSCTALTLISNTNNLSTAIAETTTQDVNHREDAHHGRRSDLEGTVETIAVFAQGPGHDQKTDSIVSQRLLLEV